MSVSITVQLPELLHSCLATVCCDTTEFIQNAATVRAKLAYDDLIKAEIERRFEAGENIFPVKEDNLKDAFSRGLIPTAKEKSDTLMTASRLQSTVKPMSS